MTNYFEMKGLEDCFEIIFSYCTTGEILACRQVSKSWKKAIDGFPFVWWSKALTRMTKTNKFFYGGGRWHYWKEIYDYLLEQRNKTKIIIFFILVSTNLQKEDTAGLNGEDFLSLQRSCSEFEVMETPQSHSKQRIRKFYVGRYRPIHWRKYNFCHYYQSIKHAVMRCEYKLN